MNTLFTKNLRKLKSEIEAYTDESNLWVIDHQINNSGGNLCLHLLGNLNTYICVPFGNTGYIRDREFEFAGKGVPREELIQKIDKTIVDLSMSMGQISTDQLLADFPIQVFKEKTSTEYMLTHLACHLTYHLGQINYHRRLLDQ